MYSTTIITGRPERWGKRQDLSKEQRNEATVTVSELTLGHHSFQPDDVAVAKLPEDRSLTQKLSPLLLPLAGSQRLYRHGDVHPSRSVQPTTADLSKFTCQSKTVYKRQKLNSSFSAVGLKHQLNENRKNVGKSLFERDKPITFLNTMNQM